MRTDTVAHNANHGVSGGQGRNRTGDTRIFKPRVFFTARLESKRGVNLALLSWATNGSLSREPTDCSVQSRAERHGGAQ